VSACRQPRWRCAALGLDAGGRQIARDGSIVMDLLAELVDIELADAVGAWSRREIARLQQPG